MELKAVVASVILEACNLLKSEEIVFLKIIKLTFKSFCFVTVMLLFQNNIMKINNL